MPSGLQEVAPTRAPSHNAERTAASHPSGVTRQEDYGFFGPESITWRVWRYPTSLTIGFQRAVVVEQLNPFLLAAVDGTGNVYAQPRVRYNRTLRYFATVAFGDTRSAVHASEILVKVHAKNGVGIEPISGRRYDANDPGQQLWIHMTAWHSILYAYETYGPGKLSEEDESRYWHECAIAAALQTIDPDEVPRSREEVRRYFERQRPRLAASETTQVMMRRILGALYEVIAEPRPRAWAPLAWIVSTAVRTATIATMPRWQRALGGLRQPRLVDGAIRPVMRFVFPLIARSKASELKALAILSPAILSVMEPVFSGAAPQTPTTLTPAQAFHRHQVRTPREVYASIAEHADDRGLDEQTPWPHPAARPGQPSADSNGAGPGGKPVVPTGGDGVFVRRPERAILSPRGGVSAGARASEALVVHYHRTEPGRRAVRAVRWQAGVGASAHDNTLGLPHRSA